MTLVDDQRVRHIRVRVGALTLDYVAPAAQADDVARLLMNSHAGLPVSVHIDDEVHGDLPPLPCSRLWEGPPCAVDQPTGRTGSGRRAG